MLCWPINQLIYNPVTLSELNCSRKTSLVLLNWRGFMSNYDQFKLFVLVCWNLRNISQWLLSVYHLLTSGFAFSFEVINSFSNLSSYYCKLILLNHPVANASFQVYRLRVTRPLFHVTESERLKRREKLQQNSVSVFSQLIVSKVAWFSRCMMKTIYSLKISER